MAHHATQGTVEASGQMAAYRPRNLTDIIQMGHSAPEALSSVASAFNNMASGLEGTPAAAHADQYRQIAAQIAAAASNAQQTGAFLEASHEADLKRIHAPRPGEHMADYSANQD